MTLSISREFNHLLDRYIETCSHYSRQLRAIEEDERVTELQKLVDSLEKLTYSDSKGRPKIHTVSADQAEGQNIVPTEDTIGALRDYCDDILRRLESPHKNMPSNLTVLQRLLRMDVLELASLFDSFTLAWDKIVEISRLTAVEDSRDIFARDTVVMSLIEFGRLVDELIVLDARLMGGARRKRKFAAVVKSRLDYAQKVRDLVSKTEFQEFIPNWSGMIDRVTDILELNWVESARVDQPTFDVVRHARSDIDFLTMLGLQLAFFCWRSVSEDATHRKLVIKSLLYYSKLLLEEKDWERAYSFNQFAIELTETANVKMGLQSNTGTSMLIANRFHAQRNLGHKRVYESIRAWDVSGVHKRYAFLKLVLLRDYENAFLLLGELLEPDATTGFPNISPEEIREWPILEELRRSPDFEHWMDGKDRAG